MACRTETKVINDHEYSVTQWPVDRSLLTKMRLIKFFGPSLSQLLSLQDKEAGLKVDVVEKMMTLLFASTTPEDVVDLIKDSVIGVARDGTKITDTSYVEHFSGDEMADVYKIFFFVLKVNYANLLKGQLVGDLLAKATAGISTK